MFAEGNGGVLPQTIRSYDVIGYDEDIECPLARGSLESHRNRSGSLPPVPDFEYVGAGLDLGKLPPRFPLAFDKRGNHPDGTRSVLFADGSVRLLSEQEFQALLRKLLKDRGGYDPRSPFARLLAYVREGESAGGDTPDTRR
jgi:prepilin-type processing-associated H-X9-DG protein